MAGGRPPLAPKEAPDLRNVSLEHARSLWNRTRKVGSCLIYPGRTYRRKNAGWCVQARQLAYAIHNGPHPGNLYTICGRPDCVNPAHITTEKQDKATGERHGRAKLNWSQVKAIRYRREKGETLRAIAERYGVSISTIGRICRGTRWRGRSKPA